MSSYLKFASICPHPPIIIPEIGGQEIKKCQKTISAMKKLADYFKLTAPETVIIISPHSPIQLDKMTILSPSPGTSPGQALTIPLSYRKREGNVFAGSFWQFGHPEIKMKFNGDPDLAEKINRAARQAKIPTEISQHSELDHGVLVPLFYLCRNRAYPVPTKLKLIPMAFSYLSLKAHFQFGQIIGQIVKKEKSKIALVASGDLSHRLTPDAPAGFSTRGQEFDQKLISLLKKNDISGILNLDENLIEEAGECGLRSIIILLGVLSQYKYQPQILSYEGPFGVGYSVINYRLEE